MKIFQVLAEVVTYEYYEVIAEDVDQAYDKLYDGEEAVVIREKPISFEVIEIMEKEIE